MIKVFYEDKKEDIEIEIICFDVINGKKYIIAKHYPVQSSYERYTGFEYLGANHIKDIPSDIVTQIMNKLDNEFVKLNIAIPCGN